MLLCLQQYGGTIRYRPGNEMQLPDALSSLPSLKQRYEILLYLHEDRIAFGDTRLVQVCKETKSC